MQKQVSAALSMINRHIGSPFKANCLDLGCANGIAENFLKDHLQMTVAIDIDHLTLSRIENSLKDTVNFLCTDSLNLPFKNNSFDLSIAFSLLHHLSLKQQQLVLENLKTITKKNGLIIMLEYNPLNPITQAVVRNNPADKGSKLIFPQEMKKLYRQASLKIIDFKYLLLTCKYMIVGINETR